MKYLHVFVATWKKQRSTYAYIAVGQQNDTLSKTQLRPLSMLVWDRSCDLIETLSKALPADVSQHTRFSHLAMRAAEKRHPHDIHIQMDDGLDVVSEDSTVSEMTEEDDSSDEEDDDETGRMGARHVSQEDVGDDSDALRWKSELWCGKINLGRVISFRCEKNWGGPLIEWFWSLGPRNAVQGKSYRLIMVQSCRLNRFR